MKHSIDLLEITAIRKTKVELEYRKANDRSEFWTNLTFKFMFQFYGPFYAIPLITYCFYEYFVLDSSKDAFKLIFSAS